MRFSIALWAFCFSCLAFAPAVHAQKTQKSKLPANFFLKTMANGLQVLVIEDHSLPLYTIEIAVKNGSYTESAEYNGLSHLYEHMFFKANRVYPSQEAFIDRTKELGMVWNGTTSEERVNYFFTTQSRYLTQGIDFMAAAIQYPLFSPEEMKKENVVVDGEFQRQESNPMRFLFDTLNHTVWADNYSRKNVIGDHQVILSATPAKMHVIQQKYYVPNNSLLTLAGDVKHDEVFQMVATKLGSWKSSSTDPHVKYPEPAFKPIAQTQYIVLEKETAKNAVMNFIWQGPSVGSDPDATYNLDVWSTMLAQNGSAFQTALVQSGLALQVSFNYTTLNHTGPIDLFVVPNPAKIKECNAAVQEQLAKISDPSYYTQAQLEKAKNQLIISDAYSKEQTSELVHTVSFWWCAAGLDYYAGYLDHVKKVSLEGVAGTVKKYISSKPFVAGAMLTPELATSSRINTFFKR